MQIRWYQVTSLAVALFASGCAALGLSSLMSGTSSFSSANKASMYVGRDVKVMFIAPAALLTDGGWLPAYVIENQCNFHTPDPIFFVPSPTTTFSFSGRLDQNRRFHILANRSLLLLGMKTAEQTSNYSIRMATLSQLPNLYVQDRLAAVENLKLPKEQEQKFLDKIFYNWEKLVDTVRLLERNYGPEKCEWYQKSNFKADYEAGKDLMW